MNAEILKAQVACYFRYEKQCAMVAFEAADHLGSYGGEPADVLVVTDSRLLYEIEVKITLSDLKHDIVKTKHYRFTNPNNHPLPINRFWFAVPYDMTERAKETIDSMYPYAGILSVGIDDGGYNAGVYMKKDARLLHHNKLSTRDLYEMSRQQSGTLCRLARSNAKSFQIAEQRWQEVLQLRQNLALAKALIPASPPEPVKTFNEVFDSNPKS